VDKYPIDHSDIDIDEFWYSHTLDEYQILSESIENHLVDVCKKLEAEAHEARQKLDDYEAKHGPVVNYEDSSYFYALDGIFADYNLFGEEFPNRVRAGLFLGIYGYIEDSLNSLCNVCQLDHEITVSDLWGAGLERATRYFKKAYGIQVPESVLRGAEFRLVQMIRNSLVHRSGRIPAGDEERKFRSLCRECVLNQEVSLAEHGEIRLNRSFLMWFIGQARAMFIDLCSELKSYLKKRSV
jgi:hypothetical protein